MTELSEAVLLTADNDEWAKYRASWQMAMASSEGIRTGTVMDVLEAETGGNVTAESVEAYFEKLKAGAVG